MTDGDCREHCKSHTVSYWWDMVLMRKDWGCIIAISTLIVVELTIVIQSNLCVRIAILVIICLGNTILLEFYLIVLEIFGFLLFVRFGGGVIALFPFFTIDFFHNILFDFTEFFLPAFGGGFSALILLVTLFIFTLVLEVFMVVFLFLFSLILLLV